MVTIILSMELMGAGTRSCSGFPLESPYIGSWFSLALLLSSSSTSGMDLLVLHVKSNVKPLAHFFQSFEKSSICLEFQIYGGPSNHFGEFLIKDR